MTRSGRTPTVRARQAIFSDQARTGIRTIDRQTAVRLFKALARFLETDAIEVLRVRNRKDDCR